MMAKSNGAVMIAGVKFGVPRRNEIVGIISTWQYRDGRNERWPSRIGEPAISKALASQNLFARRKAERICPGGT